jgi:hypothetical protein
MTDRCAHRLKDLLLGVKLLVRLARERGHAHALAGGAALGRLHKLHLRERQEE